MLTDWPVHYITVTVPEEPNWRFSVSVYIFQFIDLSLHLHIYIKSSERDLEESYWVLDAVISIGEER